MPMADFIQLMIYLSSLLLLSLAIGTYMALIFEGKDTFLSPILKPIERLIFKYSFINDNEEMDARRYIKSITWLSFLSVLIVFLLLVFQSHLPLNPQGLPDVSWALALNTAISFMTNTDWQAYRGEDTLSYLSQSLGLCVQNFISPAVGIAVLLAFIRGIKGKKTTNLGNFWQDLIRSILYVLLPLSIILALSLAFLGVVQNYSPYKKIISLEGEEQIIPMGPAASQVAIKQLGSNGGGFFGANSAHPLENPNPTSNFLQMLAILLLPASLVHMFGFMTSKRRHAWMLFSVMMALFVGFFLISYWSENLLGYPLEGKDLRFGTMNSILWSVATTASSNGSINTMHDSLSPLSGGIALFQMLLGEIIFGGVGSGLYGMLLFVLLTVFISGLMIGRTPEYMGKKIESKEILMVLLALFAPSVVVLVGSSLSLVLPEGLKSLLNTGPHGLSEILYAWSSASNNNGSAFSGLNANTNFYNLGLGFAMLAGRFIVIIPTLIIAESFSRKEMLVSSVGSLPIDNLLFAILLVGVILLLGSLTFIPALSLGPIVEHFIFLDSL